MGAGEVTGMKQTRTRALFATFFKIGAFTFGGGYAMVALLEHEFVEEKQWVTREEFLDMVAIAESTPGPMAVNSATYIGYKLEGVPGAAASTLAVCLPSFAVIYAISGCAAARPSGPAAPPAGGGTWPAGCQWCCCPAWKAQDTAGCP